MLTWDGIVSKYRKELEITDRIEAYIQSVTLKETLESVSLEYQRRGKEKLTKTQATKMGHGI